MVKDPVCGMMVNSKTPPAISEFNDKTYYFCSSGCKAEFDKDPQRYHSKFESVQNGKKD